MHAISLFLRARKMSPFATATLVLSTLSLQACVTTNGDAAFQKLEQATQTHLAKRINWQRSEAEVELADTQVRALLSNELSADDAVQIALLNNPSLQAELFELGIAEADLLQAGTLANPGLSLAYLRRGSEREVERGLHFNIAQLISMPLAIALEQRRLAQTQSVLLNQVLQLALTTRKAYIHAIAAEQTKRKLDQTLAAAQAGAELSARMLKAGNFSALQNATQQNTYIEIKLGAMRADSTAQQARARLALLLVLSDRKMNGQSETASLMRLPAELPSLPERLSPFDNPLEAEKAVQENAALEQRLDVRAARADMLALEKKFGLVKSNRFISVLEFGAVRNGANFEPTQHGVELRVELPLFDLGNAKIARAEAEWRQAASRLRATAILAHAEMQSARQQLLATYALAQEVEQRLEPLKQQILDESQLRYNGMLLSVFDLLSQARAQLASQSLAIETKRDFWLANADYRASSLHSIHSSQAFLFGTPSSTSATNTNNASSLSSSGNAAH